MSKAAESLIKNGEVSDGLLNMVEMAFRAYDPCLACASHTLPGEKTPLEVSIIASSGKLLKKIRS
jgi:F420-non-reducing hydrogenase large subunit